MIKRKLSEIATLINGYTFKSDLYKNEGIRVIRIANVQDGFISDEYPCFYPIEYVDKIGVANLKENDLLMSLTGNVGRVAYITKNLLPAGLNQRVLCIRPINENIKDYLYYFFRNSKFKTDAEKNATGIAQLNLSTKWLLDYEIPVYDDIKLAEITSNLKKLDNLIKIEKENLNNYEELIKSRFIEMFGSIEDNNKNFDIVKIEDVCSLIKDGTHQTPQYTDNRENGFKFLSSKDVMSQKIDWSNIKYISADLHKKLYATIKPQRNDILMSKNGVNYGVAAVNDTDEVFDIYVSLALLRPLEIIDPYFFRCVLNNGGTKKQFDASIKGIGVPNLHLIEIKKTKIILPPLNLQKKFVEFVKLTDKLKFDDYSRYFL